VAVRVRLFAAAREAVGASEVEVPAGSVQQLCVALERLAPEPEQARVAAVLAMSALLSDGVRYRAADDAVLPEGAVVDVLPPFAGG